MNTTYQAFVLTILTILTTFFQFPSALHADSIVVINETSATSLTATLDGVPLVATLSRPDFWLVDLPQGYTFTPIRLNDTFYSPAHPLEDCDNVFSIPGSTQFSVASGASSFGCLGAPRFAYGQLDPYAALLTSPSDGDITLGVLYFDATEPPTLLITAPSLLVLLVLKRKVSILLRRGC